MSKKNVIFGFVLGLLANLLGIVLYILLFSKQSISESLASAAQFNVTGKLVSLGAILNLILFFVFIKSRQDDKARGVLMATVMVAIIVMLNKF
jgi:hypothetical protein